MRERTAQFLRNFIFGVEDSLVSTVGLLSGVAVVGTSSNTIILAGVVLIFVEAFSMGMGSLLSENVADEFRARREVPIARAGWPALVMFFSYFIAGFIPLAPYLLFPVKVAFSLSISFSLTTLFLLGVVGARLSGTSMWRHGIEMLVFGGAAVGLGVVVGMFVSSLG